MSAYSLEFGKKLVISARKIIENYLRAKTVQPPPEFQTLDDQEVGGIFTTLRIYNPPHHDLRGCIGRVSDGSRKLRLKKSLLESAVDSAVNDPRFPPVTLDEMDQIIVEVSLLTVPERIVVTSPAELPKKVKIGVHGLIAQYGYRRGLLLPQVPVEQHWDVETFLSYTCLKAGLPAKSWKTGDVIFYRFSGKVWTEVTPRGDVEEVQLTSA